VAGCHVEAGERLSRANGVGDYRRGCIAIAEQGSESARSENLGGSEREFATQKSGIVANDDLARTVGGRMAGQIFGDALRRQPNVIECKILGDQFMLA